MSAGFDACNFNSVPMGFLGDSNAHSNRVDASQNPTNSQEAASDLRLQAMNDSKSARNEQPAIDRSVPAKSTPSKSKPANSVKPAVSQASHPRNLQRVAEARKQQGFSLRTISRRTGIDVRTLRTHELPETDLKLSELHAWQLALEVPMVDLIEDESQPLSRPVKERAALVRVMKTAVALKEAGGPPRMQRLAEMLCEQLVELMPELSEIGGWPQHGSRRTDHSCRMFEQQVNTNSLDIN